MGTTTSRTRKSPAIMDPQARLDRVAGAHPLIVVVGLPRSGTTWLAKIFDSHPDTFYCHEPDSRGALGAVPFAPDPAQSATYADAVRAFANQLPEARDIRVIGKLPLFRKSYDRPGEYFARRALVYAGKLMGNVVHATRVPAVVRKEAARTIVWKSIESTARLGTLAQILPNAKFIHIVRHPCGYVDSILRGFAEHRFSSTTPPWNDEAMLHLLGGTAQAKRHSPAVDALSSRTESERLAWLWLVQNEKAFDETRQRGNVITVRYEDLCERPEAACRALFASVGLSWAPQTQRFVDHSTRTHDSSYYALAKNPARAAHRWRGTLDPDIVRKVEAMVATASVWHWFAGAQVDEEFEHPPTVAADSRRR
jgi:hypothetical protein